jgi:hypothetical protein
MIRKARRESGNREFRGHVFGVIANAETLME